MSGREPESQPGGTPSEGNRKPRPLTPEPNAARGESPPSTLLILGRLAGFGWYVAVSVAGGALLGAWLDGELGTSPALLLAGLALGIAVAGLGLVRLLRAFGGAGSQRGDAETQMPASTKSRSADDDRS